ncbi:hypothetical protein Glove_156g37 [Diversispora epigaea]|uniref:Reverse transcriptase domain-containing protein n=1 Tax=Diversispora epigaea TaxID=1348612 RepID=A0A397IWL2_9GLOM|nr:hypothetical protein Glove_156g37 [Diversispora epigaea]
MKWIKENDRFQLEEKKLLGQNYSMENLLRTNTTMIEFAEAIRKESLHFKGIARTEKKKETLQRMTTAIKHRWEDLKENPKRMINSILDRPRQSIVMDRLIPNDQNHNPVVICDGEEIEATVRNHFYNWTRKRNFDTNILNSVNSAWYDKFMMKITTVELSGVIAKLPNKKTLEQSSLQYEWFKHLPEEGLEMFREIINTSLDLNNLPSTIFTANKVLASHNYVGLPGDDTQSPIHIINNIMEDARANERELWVMFQDMSKAFDSVNTDSLQAALKRIKIPEQFIKLMGNVSIEEIITNELQYSSCRKSIRKCGLTFLEQLVSHNGKILLHWHEISNNDRRGPKPGWFKVVKTNVIYNATIREITPVLQERLGARYNISPKKSAIFERPVAPRSNKRITEIKTLRKEKKIRSIRKGKENNDDDDETDKGDEAYEANKA